MKVSDLDRILKLDIIYQGSPDAIISDGYASDLLSDVMAKAGDKSALITIQAHKNTVAVASLVGVSAIIICNDRPVPDDMIEAAKAEDITVCKTSMNQFEVSGLLYRELRG
ncbi:MAG: hypothetical protein RBT62_02755 [Spirochaetia bacterium]|jgi:hypothetical protein|nr:hypothetical protein [Spirochaetia bacterium]